MMAERFPLQSDDIREAFLSFFASKDHLRLPSSSLVPQGDSTLLFTNAGMVQFKDIFLGLRDAPHPRATTSQKCVRAGGKHNDLDNVGYTARHHTFFEMLGNFSFGDYFKEEAISHAWEFVTQRLGLDSSRLWVTVFREDQESRCLWEKVAGSSLPSERIISMGEKDNFWAMGDTGPCGPCTEIHYDRGPQYRCQAENCGIGRCDCDRYFEIWNLVFMQYNREPSGEMVPLPKPSVDTGLGLERVASILQGVASNFDTDLFLPLIKIVEDLSGLSYSDDPRGFAFRVVADHARACAFLISDGVLPSNEGRGYVLRRILRRAVRYGKKLGIQEAFLSRVAEGVIRKMGPIYPDLYKNQDFVLKVISLEEERFEQTLNAGLSLLEIAMEETVTAGQRVIPGEAAFRLYDTYGFPRELTEELASEKGLGVDTAGFAAAMAAQRDLARAASTFKTRNREAEAYKDLGLPATTFSGYEKVADESAIVRILLEGRSVESASQGQEAEVITMATPFYPESGGQVGDAGEIRTSAGAFAVDDTQRPIADLIVHRGRVTEGYIALGDVGDLRVSPWRRGETARHHTATHLLHAALRRVLGSHVQQAGSLVTFNRLRFDFSHVGQVSREELDQVQRLVNEKIREDLPVASRESTYPEAVQEGALAFFGEKYGERVRVITAGEDDFFSKELCGGTHLRRTGEIGLCLIVSESSIGSGLRRLEAVVGAAAEEMVVHKLEMIESVSRSLGATGDDLRTRVDTLLEDQEKKTQELNRLRREIASLEGERLKAEARRLEGGLVVVSRVSDPSLISEVQEYLQRSVPSGVCVLAGISDSNILLRASVSADLTARGFSAVEELRKLAKRLGGGAGGRADWAQGGGKDPSALEGALREAEESLIQRLAHGPGGPMDSRPGSGS
ncbi:MAG: alanine--tRNA ligase [Dehalococcoidia bacterium]|nr:alanine--tRNA ligase [Dehalococcoidia bacterium]